LTRGWSRRELLGAAGALGLGSSLATVGCVNAWLAEQHRNLVTAARGVPKRPFGRSGVQVSSLALGGFFDAQANPALLDRAYALGVTYWETTLHRGGKGYGAWLALHPQRRNDIFLLAKTASRDVAGMEQSLALALAEAGTPYVDFFAVQGVDDTGFLGAEVRAFAERAKREGRIRHFGFSTHKNMAACMRAAVSLGWIDGLLTAYNYRLMQQAEIQDAVAACAQQGIALTAIKSQGLPTNPAATLGDDGPEARALLERLAADGLSEYQARLMAVWSNPNIASICSMMGDEATLIANAGAAARWQSLRAADLQALWSLARATSHGYCTGCAALCEASVAPGVPIADVMRYLMYARSYGDRARAREAFAALPAAARDAMLRQDYAQAEARCPQRIPIGALMRSAGEELA
jgi:predicted aldo/keto reductase-like oxidoreductase